ncbi:MAG: Crp/Fnr family transcriptional regulator [Bacteroidota bacterium]
MTIYSPLHHLEPYGKALLLPKARVLHLGSGKIMPEGAIDYTYVQSLEERPMVYQLDEGRLEVSRHHQSHGAFIKYLVAPGELFGEFVLTDIPTKHFFATAISPVRITAYDRHQVRTLMQQHEELNVQLLQRVALRMQQLQRKVHQLSFKDSRTRVIDFLWELATAFGRQEGEVWVVDNFLKNREIAQLTFTSRQTVNTVMNNLKKSGIIDFDPTRIEIRKKLADY